MIETTTNQADVPKPSVGILPLDETLYNIDDQALEFMRAQTGIQDAEELKRHILAVQAEAYTVRSNLTFVHSR